MSKGCRRYHCRGGMDNYIEHPLDESNGNPFKVGDYVRAYSAGTFDEFRVDKIDGDSVYTLRMEYKIHAHYKQCRLLTKKEPREFWICPECFQAWNEGDWKLDKCKHESFGIHVREVIE